MAGSDLLLPKSEEGQAGDISEYSDASRFPGLLLPANGVWERKWPEILAKKTDTENWETESEYAGNEFHCLGTHARKFPSYLAPNM